MKRSVPKIVYEVELTSLRNEPFHNLNSTCTGCGRLLELSTEDLIFLGGGGDSYQPNEEWSCRRYPVSSCCTQYCLRVFLAVVRVGLVVPHRAPARSKPTTGSWICAAGGGASVHARRAYHILFECEIEALLFHLCKLGGAARVRESGLPSCVLVC